MDLMLDDLLSSLSPELAGKVESGSIRLVRHKMANRRDGDWSGFDDLLMSEDGILRAFTAEQKRAEIFKGGQLLLLFVATTGTRCVFRSALECEREISRDEYFEMYGDDAGRYQDFRKRRDLKYDGVERVFFELRDSKLLSNHRNRIEVEWGAGARSWVQKKLDKAVFYL